jgi:hypothetical protein
VTDEGKREARAALKASHRGAHPVWLVSGRDYREEQRLELEALAGQENFWGEETVCIYPNLTTMMLVRGYWRRTHQGAVALREARRRGLVEGRGGEPAP